MLNYFVQQTFLLKAASSSLTGCNAFDYLKRQRRSRHAIARKSVCYKLLSYLPAKRVNVFLESASAMLKGQHGFRREHSTKTACKVLLPDIKRISSVFRQYTHAAFVNIKATFDSVPRKLVLRRSDDGA